MSKPSNNIGDKVLGWFIVRDDDNEQDDSGDIEEHDAKTETRLSKRPVVTSSPPTVMDEPAPPTTKSPSSPMPALKTRGASPPVSAARSMTTTTMAATATATSPTAVTILATSSGRPSFAEMYRAKGLPSADTERLAKVLDLLASLPKETSIDVKRTIVGAAMQAFHIPVDRIVDAANSAIAAVDAYVLESDRQSSTLLAKGEARIEALTQEIADVKRAMERERSAYCEMMEASAQEKSRVRSVVDFFGDQTRSSGVQKQVLVRLK